MITLDSSSIGDLEELLSGSFIITTTSTAYGSYAYPIITSELPPLPYPEGYTDFRTITNSPAVVWRAAYTSLNDRGIPTDLQLVYSSVFDDILDKGFYIFTVPRLRDGTVLTSWDGNQTSQGYFRNYVRGVTYAEFIHSGRKVYNTYIKGSNKPNYKDLVTGYKLDYRDIPSDIKINIPPNTSIDFTLSYYKNNRLEGLPNFLSIDWFEYKLKGITGNYLLPVTDCVLGTLYCDNQTVVDLISALPSQEGEYKPSDLLPSAIGQLFSIWDGLYEADNIPPTLLPNSTILGLTPFLHKLGANNDIWNNNKDRTDDLNYDPTHPMYIVDNRRSYEWHIAPQTGPKHPVVESEDIDAELESKGIGILIMDSPRTIEIHAALDASKYSKNDLDPKKPRVTNLGHLVEKIAFLLGYRMQADGKFNKPNEDKILRQIIPSDAKLDKSKVGVNNFGKDGMVLRRLNNRFSKDGIVSDQCVIVHDLLQLISEFHDQTNLAFGIQESSAIEVNNDAGTAKYNNQLEILVDLITIVKDSQEMIRAALVSGLVTQGQTSEIIAGIGLPSVTKTIPIKIDGKNTQLPYKGIAANRSLSQEIATCTYNVGIVTGQLI